MSGIQENDSLFSWVFIEHHWKETTTDNQQGEGLIRLNVRRSITMR